MSATASDDIGVIAQFLLDGVTPIGAEDTTSPFGHLGAAAVSFPSAAGIGAFTTRRKDGNVVLDQRHGGGRLPGDRCPGVQRSAAVEPRRR